ncbi:hypothetical protein HN51_009885 [Arachis hypogaea]
MLRYLQNFKAKTLLHKFIAVLLRKSTCLLDSDTGEPPQNIRAWLKFVTACCLIRSKQPAFSVVEAEELIESIICLFLDRQFQGLLVLLNDCIQAIVNYFTDQEWHSSYESIAKFVASRLLLFLVSVIVIQ